MSKKEDILQAATWHFANKGFKDTSMSELSRITGQKPVLTRARKSIANFKLREGNPIGCRVTLRRKRMYDFIYRLLNIALPRVRDFKGVSPRGFDGRGNFSQDTLEEETMLLAKRFWDVDTNPIDTIGTGMMSTQVANGSMRREDSMIRVRMIHEANHRLFGGRR